MRRGVLAALCLTAALALAAVVARPPLERAVRARIERAAATHDLAVRVDGVRVGFWPPITLTGVRIDKAAGWSLAIDRVDVTLRLRGSGLLGRAHLELGHTMLIAPAGLSFETLPTAWDTSALPSDGTRAELCAPAKGMTVTWLPGPEGGRLEIQANEVPVGRLLTIHRNGGAVLDAGTLSGVVRLTRAGDASALAVDVGGRAVRLATLGSDASASGVPAFGEPAAVALQVIGSWRASEGALELSRWRATIDGATLSGSLAMAELGRDPYVDLSLQVERLDFARLFKTSGLIEPKAVAAKTAGGASDGDLGSASLEARAKGRLADPASFVVSQRLDFTPPQRLPPAFEKLRGSFVREVALSGGSRRLIDVSPASPDFVAISDVPRLFVRTLLIGEDAGFFGHRGIDLAELPSALLTNWARGGPVRGASTITQQLAKNLFLTREKQLGRKLQELSLALLLEATLSKERILEIYLNVIEWGPNLHGLRPAARHYFHKEPAELTPAQMAFLVALIPGPLKYQSSFAHGTVLPGFRPLVDDLLRKLCSLGELDDDQYQAALEEELLVDVSQARVETRDGS